MTSSKVLVVDFDNGTMQCLRPILDLHDCCVDICSSSEVLDRMRLQCVPDAILLDLGSRDSTGLHILERLLRTHPSVKVIACSDTNDTHTIVDSIRLGAKDFLMKPLDDREVARAISACLRNGNGYGNGSQALGTVERDEQEPVEELGDELFFVAASPVMHKIRERTLQVAKLKAPVLILGESGTGKEIVARLIHKYSGRETGPFVKVNCAALPADLLESELFGYEPGAFTGAIRAKPGKFELCNKGTILLDEIGEIAMFLQAKLLHVLQDGQFSRLGGRVTLTPDVRIIAATNVDVQRAIATNKLRSDLYYRLNAFTIHLPPLRERKEEIPVLLRHYMQRLAKSFDRSPLPISDSLLETCLDHDWPGNVRELQNFVKRYLILGEEDVVQRRPTTGIAAEDEEATFGNSSCSGDLKQLVRNLKKEAEVQAIARALEDTHWSRKNAARVLNISARSLRCKIRKYGLDSDENTTRSAA
jgi:DNA-binding NtrC family response regulator